MSSQYFCQLQKFVVLELGLVLLPVSQCTEAAGFLLELVCSTPSNSLELCFLLPFIVLVETDVPVWNVTLRRMLR